MKKRLQMIISQAGVTSRRNAARIIEEGKVTVDGKAVMEKGHRLDAAEHEILVEGKPLPEGDKVKYTFLFHKPKNVISTAYDPQKRKKVTDFFKHIDFKIL